MTRLQQLLISAKHLSAFADITAARHAAAFDIRTFLEAVDLDALDESVADGIRTIIGLMTAIVAATAPEARAALATALSSAVDGVRLEIAHLTAVRLADVSPRPRIAAGD